MKYIALHKVSLFAGLACIGFILSLCFIAIISSTPRQSSLELVMFDGVTSDTIFMGHFNTWIFKFDKRQNFVTSRKVNDTTPPDEMAFIPTLNIVFGKNFTFYIHKKPVVCFTTSETFRPYFHPVRLPFIYLDSSHLKIVTQNQLIDILKQEVKRSDHFFTFTDALNADYKSFIYVVNVLKILDANRYTYRPISLWEETEIARKNGFNFSQPPQ